MFKTYSILLYNYILFDNNCIVWYIYYYRGELYDYYAFKR